MRNDIVAVALCCLGVLVSNDSFSQELSRAQAQAALQARFAKVFYDKVVWRETGYKDWLEQGGPHNSAYNEVIVTARTTSADLALRSPVKVQVAAVTGIAPLPIGQGLQEVHFTWTLVGLPDRLKPLAAWTGTGEAIMRLFDDGWRLDSISSQRFDKSATRPTPAQQAQIDQFRAAELERVRAEAERSRQQQFDIARRDAASKEAKAQAVQRELAAKQEARGAVLRRIQEDTKVMDRWAVGTKWMKLADRKPRVVREFKPSYTTQAMKDRAQGSVEVEAIVEPSGEVLMARVLTPLHPDLDEAAIVTARRWRFEPGVVSDQPVPCSITISFSFALK